MQWFKDAVSREKANMGVWLSDLNCNGAMKMSSRNHLTSKTVDLAHEYNFTMEETYNLDKHAEQVPSHSELPVENAHKIRWEKRLPRDIWLSIAKFISVTDLSSFFRTCKSLNFNRTKTVWRAKCVEVWRENIVTPEFILLAKGINGNPKEALRLSFLDGTRRMITTDDLCNTTWNILHNVEKYNLLFKTKDKAVVKGRSELHRDFKHARIRRRRLLPDGHIGIPGDKPKVNSMRRWRWKIQERQNGRFLEQYFVYSGHDEFPHCRVIRLSNWGWAMKSSIALWLSFHPGEKPELLEQDFE